jgi:hypothetical protein
MSGTCTFALYIVRLRGAITPYHAKALARSIHAALLRHIAGIWGYELEPLKRLAGEAYQEWHLELTFWGCPEPTAKDVESSLSALKGIAVESCQLLGRARIRGSKVDPMRVLTPEENKKLDHRYTQAKSRARSAFKG